MPMRLTAQETLDRYFLDLRHRVLDVAAAMDRFDLTPEAEPPARDPRVKQLREALMILADGRPDRAARVQHVFSDLYDPDWRQAFGSTV